MTFKYPEDTVMGELERIKSMVKQMWDIMQIAKEEIQ